jgi:hypothetical protein
MMQLPVPVHVGAEAPEVWDDIESQQRKNEEGAAPWLRAQQRPAVASPSLDWGALGLEPRWVRFYTDDCVAALQPSIFSGRGADEFHRFRSGAEGRGEVALVISTVGVTGDAERSVNVFGPPASSLFLGRVETVISARELGKGVSVRAAGGLSGADKQLALRMLGCTPAPLWRSLSLRRVEGMPRSGQGEPPGLGTLVPVVETAQGEPVVAAWESADGIERRYVVPAETPWPLLLQWLAEHALPELVPGAMLRARHPLAAEPALMTCRERSARTALTELQADYAARRQALESELKEAEAAASELRDGLLFGSGTILADTVRQVLEWAGVTVADLDEQLGGTANADLLCTYRERSRVVEVKSASGSASERVYQDLVRHLREWEKLPGSTSVEGGALVLNHQHRKAPHERDSKPYGRPEFLAAQAEPVITTMELFDAWREENDDAVRRLLFGDPGPVPEPASPPVDAEPVNRKQGWLRRR